VLAFLVLLAGSIVAQTPEHTTIKGSVADSLGARIGKAEIRVLDSITHAIVARAVTDQLGAFEVEVSPGNYVITVRVVGFRLGISPEVAVREGETASLGELRLDVPPCDAPGIFCDTFYQTPAEPRVTEPIKQAGVDLKLNCGLDILTGATSCPPSSDADFTLESDGRSLYVKPLRGATIWYKDFPFDGCTNHDRGDTQIRIDGLGGGLRYGLDFCVLRRDRLVSHVYLNRDVAADSKEAHFFFATTRR
jgi:hypothetical protein